MLLKNTFEVPLSAEDTWRLLTDLSRIAPCLPGTAQFLERDEVAHRAVIAVRGRAERGSGSARATITASLHPEAAGTRVDLATEVAVSGRAAPFGDGLPADVSSGMISDFARRLEALIAGDTGAAAGDTGAAAGGAGAFGPTGAAAAPTEAHPDVVRTVGLPVASRVLVPLASAAAGGVIGWLAARWRGRATPAGRGLPDRRDAGRAADRFDDVGQVEGDQCAPQMGGERLGCLRLVA
jgi:uncharacterized protein